MIHVWNASAAKPKVQWSWVTLSGPDAQDFLHRVTTVNTRSMAAGEGARGCFLTPQGKIRAYFSLWNFAPGDYAFEFDAGPDGEWKKELLAAIDQYTFAEKITLTDVTSLECRWILAGGAKGADDAEEGALLQAIGAPGLKPRQTAAVDEEIRLCHQGRDDYGRAWVTAWGRGARLAQWLERALPQSQEARWEELEQWRVLALRPRVGHEITHQTIPLEAGLVDALAQGKGCYPGQEVIERIAALGAPARRLARIEGQGTPPPPGTAIFNLAEPPAEVGQVTSSAKNPGNETGFVALGFVRKIHAKEGLEVRFAHSNQPATLSGIAPYTS